MKLDEHSARSVDRFRLGKCDAPYIRVVRRGGDVQIRGQAKAAFGHRIQVASHRDDDGIFAGWNWDGERLVVSNDRYGFQPLFWSALADGGVAVSPSLLTLIDQGARAELDIEALAVFFRLGYFLGEDTPFAAIRSVPPHASFTWKDGQLECVARYPGATQTFTGSRDEAIDEYIALFAQAMARRSPGDGACAIPISGGRDSRHILLELHRTGFQPDVCVSGLDHPPDPNEDPKIAAELCRELGFPLVVIDQQLPQFAAQVRKNRETHFCATAHGWYLALADFLNGRFASAYDGIAGDVLSQSKFLKPDLDVLFHREDPLAICDALFARHASSFHGIRTLLNGPLQACLDPGAARTRLAREITRHLGRPNPVGSFIFWNRTRREIALAPYSLLHGIDRVYSPFVDHDLFDFLTTLPSSMLIDHCFHDDTIARAYPHFAHIPYAHNAISGSDDRATRTRFATDAARALMLGKRSRLTKNVMPRAKLLATLVSGGRVAPWVSPTIIYLHQLELILDAQR